VLCATAGARSAKRAKAPTTTTARKARRTGPTADWVNECTDAIVPERVRNVPRIVRAKAAMTRTKFHDWSIRRRSWTSAEWRKAVETSQGMKDAFSTGSHAQYPPHDSTSYAHHPPRTIPRVRKIQATRVERRERRSQSTPGRVVARAAIA